MLTWLQLDMATSDVEICNMALTMIGEDFITALTDNSPRARIANLFYNRYRDAVLGSHFWNGAMKRETLVRLVDTPTFGFAYAFQLPTDYIRLKAVQDNPHHYRVESGKRILQDNSTCNILYVYRVTNPGDLGDLYADALSTKLAAVFAGHFKQPEMAVELMREARARLATARNVDSSENPAEPITNESWASSGRLARPQSRQRTDI